MHRFLVIIENLFGVTIFSQIAELATIVRSKVFLSVSMTAIFAIWEEKGCFERILYTSTDQKYA